MSEDGKTKVITRRVLPEDLPDLLTSPPQAYLAFVEDLRIDAIPVEFRYEDERYLFRTVDLPASLIPGAHVYLLVDDGEFYTQLRGIAIAGRIADRLSSPGGSDAANWLEIVPDRLNAWNYGAMRRKTQ